MKKWEYLTIEVPYFSPKRPKVFGKVLMDDLNALGAEGWELVAITSGRWEVACFKRLIE
jgi:hypothetical protein